MRPRGSVLLPLSLLLLSAWLLAGCMVSYRSHSVVFSGYKIRPEAIAFVRPGVTKRAEILSELGTVFTEVPAKNVIAYQWTEHLGQTVLFGKDEPIMRTSALFIRFDQNNVVIRKEIVKLEKDETVETAAHRWIEVVKGQ